MGRSGPKKGRGLSVREYVDHRRRAGLPGGNKSAVQKALKSGRISYISGNPRMGIDPEAADRAWNANTNPAKQNPAAAAAARASLEGREGNGLPALPHGEVPDYQVSRARKEHYDAELKRLELAEKLGQVIQTAAAARKLQAAAGNVRQRLLILAPRLAPELVALVHAQGQDGAEAALQVERFLGDELRRVLEVLHADPTGEREPDGQEDEEDQEAVDVG